MHIESDIFVEVDLWHKAISNIQSYTTAITESILSNNLHTETEHVEISIVLSDNRNVQKLNKTYRGKDKPTNVLSFPQTTASDIHKAKIPVMHLGDIIIAYETIESEAREQNKSIRDHYTHMLVHGCLHLLHYDHETDDDAAQMEQLEIKILETLNIKNPYETD